eukprot:g858.t1
MDLPASTVPTPKQRELLQQISCLVRELCETGYDITELQLAVRGSCVRAGGSRKLPALTSTAAALVRLPAEVLSVVLLCCDAPALGKLTCVSRFFRIQPREPEGLIELSITHPARLRFGRYHVARARQRAGLTALRAMEELESQAFHGLHVLHGKNMLPWEKQSVWNLFNVLASGKWNNADLADGLRLCDPASLVLLLGDSDCTLMQRMGLAKALAGPLKEGGEGGNQDLRRAKWATPACVDALRTLCGEVVPHVLTPTLDDSLWAGLEQPEKALGLNGISKAAGDFRTRDSYLLGHKLGVVYWICDLLAAAAANNSALTGQVVAALVELSDSVCAGDADDDGDRERCDDLQPAMARAFVSVARLRHGAVALREAGATLRLSRWRHPCVPESLAWVVMGDRQAKDVVCAELSLHDMWDMANDHEDFTSFAMLLVSLLSGGQGPSHQQLIGMRGPSAS